MPDGGLDIAIELASKKMIGTCSRAENTNLEDIDLQLTWHNVSNIKL